jgi:hypothetical protein
MYFMMMWLRVKELWGGFRCWLYLLPLKMVDKYLQGLADREVDEWIYLRQGTDNEVIELIEPFHSFGLTVPAGYTPNGASSPRFAWWIIPRLYKMIKASTRHDYACETARCWWDRLVADIVFFLMAYYVERLALWRCIAGLIGVRIGALLGIGKNY